MTKIVVGEGVELDLEQLVESRLLVQAQSGGGKTTLLRRILEQSHGKVQQIVIDPEGEFYTLREKFDYIIAGKGGDCAADPRSAKLLARRLLKLGVPAVCDLYELKAHDRIRFVRYFLEALVDAPRELRHPVLVVIDEAHIFCPEKGQAESAAAVIDICARGRKRGLCPLLATQRLSKLHKDAAAELRNVLIGATGLDIDQQRAGDVLGFSKADRIALRDLKWREFFAYGPALSPGVIRLTVGETATQNPKVGREMAAPAAPTQKMRALLQKVADLPAEAEQEARTLEDVRRELTETRRKLTLAEKSQRVETKACDHERELMRLTKERDQYLRDRGHVDALLDATRADVGVELIAIDQALANIRTVVRVKKAASMRGPARAENGAESTSAAVKQTPNRQAFPRPSSNGHSPDLTGPEQRILNALAWWEAIGVDAPVKSNVGFIAGYRVGKSVGGTFGNMLGQLRSKALIDYPQQGAASLTGEGRALAQSPEAMPTRDALHDAIYARLDGPEKRVLAAIIEIYPESATKQEIGEAAGYTVGPSVGGTYGNILGRLRSLGLIDYPAPGRVVATQLLFPEGT